jgi:RNA polymerase sigma-70 factor (ECF subfamily)
VADPDAALVRAASGGDPHAFELLYRRHVRRIHGLCRHLCGDAMRADTATQDAFVRAWEKLGTFRGEALFSTWLHRLTVHVVLGEQRVLKRWVTFEDPADFDAIDTDRVDRPHERTADRLDLEAALAKLPKGARTVLLLHDVEGYKHEEIAEATGIAVGTSKAQLHRARKLMKEWLQ